MGIDSVETLVDTLAKSRLLDHAQLDELTRDLRGRFADPRLLARELLSRNWLTSLQINYLFQGRGRDLVLGSYVLLERIGEGKMGQVFKARHQHLKRIAAVKIIRADLLSHPEAVERFYHEIQVSSRLSHPNIVHAYDAGPVGQTHFFAVEYVEGIDLEKLVKQSGPLPVEEACDFIHQTAQGLHHAYEKGMLHQDCKPANLLMTQAHGPQPVVEGQIKIRNLGLTPLEMNPEDSLTAGGSSQLGKFLGALDYRAPELADPEGTADVRSEIYSLGCTFYYLLTGQVPFPGGSALDKISRHQSAEPTPVELLRPGVPPELTALLRRLMAKRPEDRCQTTAELIASCKAHGLQPVGLGVQEAGIQTSPDQRQLAQLAPPEPLGIPAASVVTENAPFDVTMRIGEQGASSRRRLREAAERRRWLKMVVAGCSLLLGLSLLMLVLLVKANPKPKPSPSGDTVDPSQSTAGPGLWTLDQLTASSIPKKERLWAAPELVAVLGSHRGRHWGEASCLAYSPNGELLASCGHDRDVRIWNANTLEKWSVLKQPARVFRLAFAPDSRTLVSAGEDGAIRLWNTGTEKQIGEFTGHEGKVLCVAFSPDGKLVVGGGEKNIIWIWDIAKPKPNNPLAACGGHSNHVQSVAFSPDGKTLASGSTDKTVRLWEVPSGKPRDPPVLMGHNESVVSVVFSNDGKILASGSHDRTIRSWNIDGDKPVERPVFTQGPRIYAMAISPDNKTLASSGEDANVRLWDLTKDQTQKPAELSGHFRKVNAVAFAPDGKTLASAGEDAAIRLWEVTGASGRARPVPPGHMYTVLSLAFSPDFKTLASGGEDRTARLWDLTQAEPKEIKALSGHDGGVSAVAFSSDGKRLLTRGGRVRLWNWTSPETKPQADWAGELSGGSSSAIAPDAKSMIATEGERLVRWDLTTGKKISELPMPGPVRCLLFAADSRHLAVGNNNGTIYILRLAAPSTKSK